MKRNIVIAAVTAAALIGGGTATALATSGEDDPGKASGQADVRGSSSDDGDDTADDADADDRDDAARAASAKVTAADALAAALKKTPGTAVSADLDGGDDGERAAWEVDVLSGDGTWHSVRIDPASGKVLGSQTDDEDDTDEVRAALKGTSVDAAEAVRAASGHGTVTSVELDEDGHHGDGETAWEVETRASGKAEQDWRVDPRTGEVTADRSHDSHSDDSRSDDSDDADDSGSDDD
ncbi:putative Asp-rich hydrophilic protein (membrane protein) [Streptomyces ambofaciens ATCC 23877]|uniref:Putative Asp-rich hydrophilic protein (Membrane protein) n=1 Tax=Streptomyces ambofaciens (strain ATCC 23877 / 3486 / DSM 40053 / JCM 4204 / NBRC 12836 / NRRL B-2516) TaxID=278992 RepID=A0A0K2AYU2_STRA7|nr:PepSY domain-containing protein [Streptomyces ambofaciens]AKZ58194.1 putative Asp-rich hydrophilic protein (membrane protein) [Streptomyces ambofaciens ATCC 23877]